MSTGVSWRRGSATLVTGFEEGGSPHGNSCSPYSLSSLVSTSGLIYFALRKSENKMTDFHVREKFICGDEQGCELMGWACSLHCIHPGWFHSWEDP